MKNSAFITSLTLVCCLTALPTHAGELLSSPLYSSSAAFDSLSNSSDMVAEGDYQIVRIEPAETRQGYDLLTLRDTHQAGPQKDFRLLVPTANVDMADLRHGQIVSAHKKTYGMVFTATGNTTFAIVLNQAWQKDMAIHKVL